MPTIPRSIDDVTAEWLTTATGLDVTGVEHEIIGVGLGVSSAVYRLHLTGTDVPDSLVLKLPALDEAAVFTSSMLRMYEREVKFFDELAARVPARVPGFHGGAVDEGGAGFYLLMEDMGAHRRIDQVAGMELHDAEHAVDALARWHAEFWNDGDHYIETGAAVSLADPVYQQVLPLVFAEGWQKIQAEMDVAPAIARVAPRWVDSLPSQLSRLSASPTTVVHGDYRADNIFFADDHSVVLLDFQLIGVGAPSYDLAYFVTQSLEPDVAGANERDLFDRYRTGLLEAGVPEADTTRLWDDYRVGALFCLVYPIVACRGMDLDDPRQRDLISTMNLRFERAVEQLELEELL